MSGTAVQQEVCSACGTEIRNQALFCYHCGEAVEMIDEPIPMPETGAKLKKGRKRAVREVSEDESDELDESSEELQSGKRGKNGKRDLNLRTAASLKNKARRVEPKRVEIYWEEHESAPNSWFLLVSLLIVVFTIIIFVLAMYLK